MNWTATIVGILFVAVGIVEIFFPDLMSKWDVFVGRGPSTKPDYKILGGIMLFFGIGFIVVFNFLEIIK